MRKWLKNIRTEHKMTVHEMAEILDMDVDFYETIETGQLPLNIPVLIAAKIADIFDISLSRLILLEEEYKNNYIAEK